MASTTAIAEPTLSFENKSYIATLDPFDESKLENIDSSAFSVYFDLLNSSNPKCNYEDCYLSIKFEYVNILSLKGNGDDELIQKIAKNALVGYLLLLVAIKGCKCDNEPVKQVKQALERRLTNWLDLQDPRNVCNDIRQILTTIAKKYH